MYKGFPETLKGDVNSCTQRLSSDEQNRLISVRDHARHSKAALVVANSSIRTKDKKKLLISYNCEANPSDKVAAHHTGGKSVSNKSRSTYARSTAPSRSSKSQREAVEQELRNNAMLSRAFDILKQASSSFDAYAGYFEAAQLFDKLKLFDRAVKYYHKSLLCKSPEYIVDTHHFPPNPADERKIERLGKAQQEKFIKNRNDTRENFIREESMVQEYRGQEANLALFRIYLVNLVDREKAHIHLRDSFRSFHPDRMENYYVTLVRAHELLRDYVIPAPVGEDISENVITGSGGPLADAHLVILHELYSTDENSIEFAEWLGRRYSEKCNFKEGRVYFKRVMDIKDAENYRKRIQETPSMSTTFNFRKKKETNLGELPDIHLTSSNQDSTAARSAIDAKSTLTRFGKGVEEDEGAEQRRCDFTHFDRKHIGGETVVYIPPPAGWNNS